MQEVALANNFIFGRDVKLLSMGKVSKFYDYIKSNPNSTFYTVVWCTDEWEITPNVSIPC